MNVPALLAAAPSVAPRQNQMELLYVWDQARPEAKLIICFLALISITAWFVMISKVLQMRSARKLNQYFLSEFKSQPKVLGMFDRRLKVDACPLFKVYE